MNPRPATPSNKLWNKVPEITLIFWLIKMMSTTIGETGADFLNINKRHIFDRDRVGRALSYLRQAAGWHSAFAPLIHRFDRDCGPHPGRNSAHQTQEIPP